MTATYTATSLQDIADHFDAMADTCADRAVNAKTKRTKDTAAAEARTWSTAARFLEKAEIGGAA